jgi:hypothetical protein
MASQSFWDTEQEQLEEEELEWLGEEDEWLGGK